MSPLPQIHRATAAIVEPTGESDNPLRFTSGLVLALDVDATLEHVQDPQSTVKVQVGPGAQLHLFYRSGFQENQWFSRNTRKKTS